MTQSVLSPELSVRAALPLRPALAQVGRAAVAFGQLCLASQGFVALCAVALTYETSRIAGIPAESIGFYGFIFCATLCSYRLHAHAYAHGRAPSVLVSAATFFAACALLPSVGWDRLILIGIASALAWGYSRPLFPGARRLREYGVAKILVLTGVWTLITCLLPLIGRADAPIIALLCVRRFLFVFALCVAFDIRDRARDTHTGILTVPVRIGLARSYGLMRLALGLFAGLSVLLPAGDPSPVRSGLAIALAVSAVGTWLVVESARGRRSAAFYLAGVDGMMLLQCLLVCWASAPSTH